MHYNKVGDKREFALSKRLAGVDVGRNEFHLNHAVAALLLAESEAIGTWWLVPGFALYHTALSDWPVLPISLQTLPPPVIDTIIGGNGD